ncbi:MAG: hypothetical protein ACF8PN_09265 [Phycisphaerales bacterium]
MFRPGADPNHIEPSDVLCDFCHSPWTDDRPMIEGHQGSVICGGCLAVAYAEVVLASNSTAPEGYKCRMCLETRDEPAWASPLDDSVVVCERCLKLGAKTLEKDPDYGWRRPG